jgi:hypothetical protein
VELWAHFGKFMGVFKNLFILHGRFKDILMVSVIIKDRNICDIRSNKFFHITFEKGFSYGFGRGLNIVSFALFKSCLCAGVFDLMSAWVGANTSKLPINNFSCINVHLLT